MGACLSFDQDDKVSQARSEDIDRQLQLTAKQDSTVIKILLLGAGESGKSTLVKQMKIIHSDGFTEEELFAFKAAVLENLVSSMKFVLSGMGLLRINLENPQNRTHAQALLSSPRCYDERQGMYPHISNALWCLLDDAGVQHAIARGYEYELNDSATYYFTNMERICSKNFCPTQVDVLRARVRTQGVIETCFRITGFLFRMFDVGGQRSERRKWIQCFDDCKALLFVTSLSGFDMTLLEDPNINRLEESLKLFHQVGNTRFFLDTSLILFLNKLDLFKEKILQSQRHLRYYFSKFKGPDHDVDQAAMFILKLFQSRLTVPRSKLLYPHFTTATDTSNIQVVFQVITQTIIRDNLRNATLL